MKAAPWRYLTGAAILAGALVLYGCGRAANGETESKEAEEIARIPVQTAAVRRGRIAASYAGTAILEAEREAVVVAKTDGVLLELLVEEGDRVEQGDVLARLERAQQSLSVAQAQAELKRLKSDFARIQQMYERKLVSAEQYEQVRFQLAAQQAIYDLARLQLDYTTVEAPISGTVSRRLVKEGNLIERYQPLFEIHDFDPLHAVLHVPEQQMGLLEPELDVAITSAAYAGRKFHGQVLRTSPVVDGGTGTFEVTVEIPNAEKYLKPGMFVSANIVYEVHEGVPLIPRTALLNEDGATSVFIAENGVARKQAIRVGFSNSGDVEVVEGLEPGMQVVTIGHAGLREGAPITVVGAGTPESAQEAKVAANEPD